MTARKDGHSVFACAEGRRSFNSANCPGEMPYFFLKGYLETGNGTEPRFVAGVRYPQTVGKKNGGVAKSERLQPFYIGLTGGFSEKLTEIGFAVSGDPGQLLQSDSLPEMKLHIGHSLLDPRPLLPVSRAGMGRDNVLPQLAEDIFQQLLSAARRNYGFWIGTSFISPYFIFITYVLSHSFFEKSINSKACCREICPGYSIKRIKNLRAEKLPLALAIYISFFVTADG